MESINTLNNTHIIQLKRGTQHALETILVDDNKPASGELIFELPSTDHPQGRLKLGTGIANYADLTYLPDNVTLDSMLSIVKDAVIKVEEVKTDVTRYAIRAEDAAARAENAQQAVADIPDKTIAQVEDYMNNKLNFMTMSQFNKLERINPEGFYFITVID